MTLTLESVRSPLLLAGLPRLTLIGFTIVQPFLIQTESKLVADSGRRQDHKYGMIGAFALVYIGIAVL